METVAFKRAFLVTCELAELLPTLKDLSRTDKLRVMQFLVSELAKEEEALLHANEDYPVWSPYNSYEAANVLLEILKVEDKACLTLNDSRIQQQTAERVKPAFCLCYPLLFLIRFLRYFRCLFAPDSFATARLNNS